MAADPTVLTREELWHRRKSALEFALREHLDPSRDWENDCQMFVRMALGAPGGVEFATARLAFLAIPLEDRHPVGGKHPPAGVPGYFRTRTRNWHVGLSAGKGEIWSTDILRRGHIDKVTIPYIERRWGAVYIGWPESINGRRVWPK